MINPNELRRGNLFADLSGKTHQVKGIHEDCIVIEYFSAVISDFTPGGKGDFSDVWPTKSISFEDAAPIPITAEMLEKCGFDNRHERKNIDPQIELVYNTKIQIMEIWDRQDWEHSCVDIPCKYLHQLQNLFYCLTGQELEVSQ